MAHFYGSPIYVAWWLYHSIQLSLTFGFPWILNLFGVKVITLDACWNLSNGLRNESDIRLTDEKLAARDQRSTVKLQSESECSIFFDIEQMWVALHHRCFLRHFSSKFQKHWINFSLSLVNQSIACANTRSARTECAEKWHMRKVLVLTRKFEFVMFPLFSCFVRMATMSSELHQDIKTDAHTHTQSIAKYHCKVAFKNRHTHTHIQYPSSIRRFVSCLLFLIYLLQGMKWDDGRSEWP